MKKIVFILLTVLLFSCTENKEQIQSDVQDLTNSKVKLMKEYQDLSDLKIIKQHEVDSLNEKLKYLNLYSAGKKPVYILKIHLRQSHFSLSISKHIKDAMNAIDFELPVSEEFYNSVSEGTEILNEFRSGSFILYGSFGDWRMSVKGKEIR